MSKFPAGPVMNLAPAQFSRDPVRPFDFADARGVEGAREAVPGPGLGAGVGEGPGAAPTDGPGDGAQAMYAASAATSILGPAFELDGPCWERRVMIGLG